MIIACFITGFIAFKFADDKVDDDYFKQGKMLDKSFDASQVAKDIGLQATLAFDLSSTQVEVVLKAEDRTWWLDQKHQFHLLLSHPAKAAQDQILPLKPGSGTRLSAAFNRAYSGRWYLRLSAMDSDFNEVWRLQGEVDFSDVDSGVSTVVIGR